MSTRDTTEPPSIPVHAQQHRQQAPPRPPPPAAQQQPRPQAFVASFSRRYACDRCRGHKLRCNRDSMTSDSPCQRCRKARAKCTIGASLKAGPGDKARKQQRQENNACNNTAAVGALDAAAMPVAAPCDQESIPIQRQHNLPIPSRHASGDAPMEVDTPSDSLHLNTISWPDILGPGFDGSQEMKFGDGPESATDVMLATSFSSPHTAETSFPFTFPAAPDSFGVASGFQVPAGPSRGTASYENGTVSPLQTPADDGFAQSRGGSGEPARVLDRSLAMLPDTTKNTLSPRPGSMPGSLPFEDYTASWTDRKDKHIQALLDLSASLMKDLHRAVTCKLASSFLFARSEKNAAEFLFKTMDGSICTDNAIGRMLHGSERFLEILRTLNQSASIPSSEISEPTLGRDFFPFVLEGGSDTVNGCPETRSEERWKALQVHLQRPGFTPASLPSGMSMPTAEHNVSLPSTLAILTTYTCLIKIHEIVFYVIHHSLECDPAWAAAIKLDRSVSGLQMNGFMLQNHRSLQTKILIQITTYLLDSVESELGGYLSDPMFRALLKTSMQQQGLDYAHNETGTQNVRELMRRIDQMSK